MTECSNTKGMISVVYSYFHFLDSSFLSRKSALLCCSVKSSMFCLHGFAMKVSDSVVVPVTTRGITGQIVQSIVTNSCICVLVCFDGQCQVPINHLLISEHLNCSATLILYYTDTHKHGLYGFVWATVLARLYTACRWVCQLNQVDSNFRDVTGDLIT